jgi:hypothetical protein
MAIGNKQIGWSQEENLLWQISKQLDSMNSILCTGPCPTTTTTTTTASCNCSEISEFEEIYNYYNCLGVNIVCTEVPCKTPLPPFCIDISLPYSGVVLGGVTENCNCNS